MGELEHRTPTPKPEEVEGLRREIERLHVLGSSHRLVDAVLDQSPHGIIICDGDGRLILHNRAAEKIWAGSIKANDIEGWNHYRAFHPDGRPFGTGDWSMARCLRTRQPMAAEEIHIQRFDGSHGFLLGSSAPIFGPDGALQGAVSVFADITSFKQAANRSSRLQTITGDLSQALTEGQVAAVVVEQSAAELEAATAGLWLLSAGGDFVDLAHSSGYSDAGKQRFSRLPVKSVMRLPVLDVVAQGQPVWLSDRKEFAAQYPDVAAAVPARAEYAIACLPLMVHGRAIGALTFTFDARRTFDSEERGFLLVLARHSAQALERARLFEAERRARAEAEAAQERMTFLLECSGVLGSSLDFQETLNRVAHLAVPRMADWCAVDIVQDGSEPSQLAVAHADPTKQALAQDMRRRYPPDPSRPSGVGNVIRTGKSELFEEIQDELLVASAHSSEHLQAARELGLKSAIVVPMSARGRTFGAITFVFGESGRRYGRAELETAELLGRRAGIAIDNARLYEKAEAAARTREQVLAVVSHDLRNPLGVIMMNAMTLARLEVNDPIAAPRVKKNAESVRRSADRMSRMIGDLLDLASIEAGQLSIERSACSPAEVAAAALEPFLPVAQERQVQLAIEIQPDCPAFACDRDRVIQVFANLLSNAVKVTPAGGTITVSVAPGPGTDIVFSVGDTGPGVAAADMPRLFERFFRSQTATYKGTGLGLTIAKGIVDAHEGRIWVESREGEGTVFFFSIPLSAPPIPASPP